MIGSTNDGRLDLNDVFVQDDETGIFAEPDRAGEMPTGSLHFQEIPWELESFGDILYDKPRWVKVRFGQMLSAPAWCWLDGGGSGYCGLAFHEPLLIVIHFISLLFLCFFFFTYVSACVPDEVGLFGMTYTGAIIEIRLGCYRPDHC